MEIQSKSVNPKDSDHLINLKCKFVHDSWSQNGITHPEHMGFGSLVAGPLRYKGNSVVESVLEQTWTKARACGDAARNYDAGENVRWMLEEFTLTGPYWPRQEHVIHR